MAIVFRDPDGQYTFAAQHSPLAEHGGLDAHGADAPQHALDSLAVDDRYGHAKHATGIADRNLKRFSNIELLRAQKINHGEDVLDWFREIQRGNSRRLVLIRVALSPGNFPLFVIENRVADAHAFALFVEFVGSQKHELIGIDNRFDMLVKVNPGKLREETLADDVANQAQGIPRGGLLRMRAKAELANIRAAQQGPLKLGF